MPQSKVFNRRKTNIRKEKRVQIAKKRMERGSYNKQPVTKTLSGKKKRRLMHAIKMEMKDKEEKALAAGELPDAEEDVESDGDEEVEMKDTEVEESKAKKRTSTRSSGRRGRSANKDSMEA